MSGRSSLLAVAGLAVAVLAGCRFDRSALGLLAPDAGRADGAPADAPATDGARTDGLLGDGAASDRAPAADAGALHDAPADAASTDAAPLPDAGPDVSADAGVDAGQADSGPACSGVLVEGFCWYASAPDQSCTAACASHGGCNLAGTRDFAGSGGSDDKCVLVLAALGYGGYRHQNWSNNDLGCQFAWPDDPWTYWSSAVATTCEAAYPGAAHAVRMCACNL